MSNNVSATMCPRLPGPLLSWSSWLSIFAWNIYLHCAVQKTENFVTVSSKLKFQDGVQIVVKRYASLFLRKAPDLNNTETFENLRAGSHFDISISTSINISIRKIREIRVNRGYLSIRISISTRNGTFSQFLMLILRAGSHFDISISTSINISIRKIRKICVNRGFAAMLLNSQLICLKPVEILSTVIFKFNYLLRPTSYYAINT